MLLCDRRGFLILCAAGLVGCGFSPLYAPGGAATGLQNSILPDDPSGRADYLLVRRFEERLGSANPATYGLSYSVVLVGEAVAISSANITTHYTLLGSITYALRDLTSQEVLTSGRVDSFTSYSASGTTVATAAARRDAEDRLMVIMTDQMITRLAVDAGDGFA